MNAIPPSAAARREVAEQAGQAEHDKAPTGGFAVIYLAPQVQEGEYRTLLLLCHPEEREEHHVRGGEAK